MHMLLYEVDDQQLCEERVQETQEAEQSREQCWSEQEVSWGDANVRKLDLVQVRLARKAEMESFREIQAYKKVPKQKCRRVTGKKVPPQKTRNNLNRRRVVANDLKRSSG